jgi:gamma-glutamylcyclotransferase (GGCT)/AIG2-like uncharacterized protein YtfP
MKGRVGFFRMSERVLLFVYGLLRPSEAGFQSLGLAGKVEVLRKDRVQGRLYHLGDYPGMILGEAGIVHGDVIAVEDAALMADIDAYELCEPERPRISEYRRVEAELLDSGERAWVYEYNRPIKGRPVIASGNWWSR